MLLSSQAKNFSGLLSFHFCHWPDSHKGIKRDNIVIHSKSRETDMANIFVTQKESVVNTLKTTFQSVRTCTCLENINITIILGIYICYQSDECDFNQVGNKVTLLTWHFEFILLKKVSCIMIQLTNNITRDSEYGCKFI